MIAALVLQLDKYFNAFLVEAACHMKTGLQIDHCVIDGLLSSNAAGDKEYQD